MNQLSPVETLRAAGVDYDPGSLVVTVDGRRTVIDARSGNVIAALAERFGACVTKTELLERGWPGQIVHENSLAKSIGRLRRCLEGSDVEIAAAYGMGYILRTRPEALAAAGDAAAAAPPLPTASRRKLVAPLAVAIAALSVAAIAGTTMLARSGLSTPPIRTEPPVTNDRRDAVATILWVDDHPSNNALEIEAFRQEKIAVHQAESTQDALRLLAMNNYRLVISDLGRGEDRLAGLKMIGEMARQRLTAPVIIYTLRPKDPQRQEAQRRMVAGSGAAGLVLTPAEVRAEIFRRLAVTPEVRTSS